MAATGSDFMGPFEAQKEWGREFAGPLSAVWEGAQAAWRGAERTAGGEANTWPVYDTAKTDVALFAVLVLTVPAVVGALRRLPAAYSLYAAAALAIPLSYPSAGQPL